MSDTETPDTGDEPTSTSADTTGDATQTETDWAAEAEKWKAQARKHEDRAKKNAAASKELDELRKTSMSDQERLVSEAVEATKAEVRAEYGALLVAAEIKASASGLPLDVDTLLESVDASRFLTDDGEPDQPAIEAWLKRLAPSSTSPGAAPAAPGPPAVPDLGQGARSADYGLGGDQLLADLKAKVGL